MKTGFLGETQFTKRLKPDIDLLWVDPEEMKQKLQCALLPAIVRDFANKGNGPTCTVQAEHKPILHHKALYFSLKKEKHKKS